MIFSEKIFNFFKKNVPLNHQEQSGRSMLEMLGVLAVIGLLSIGILSAIIYGMNKYRANTIIQDVSLMAATIITNEDFLKVEDEEQIIVTELPNMRETQTGYPIYAIRVNSDIFGVTVEEVSDRVCQLVVEGPNPSDFYIEVNGVSTKDLGSTLCDEENQLVFYFDAYKEKEWCGGQICNSGFVCDEDSESCVCPENKHEENGQCVCDAGLESCGDKCYEFCSGEYMTGFRDENSCLCQCDTNLGLELLAKEGYCECPVGSVFLDGKCQVFGCTGGTKGNQDWTCQIDRKRCGYRCSEDGSMCFFGLCMATQCSNTSLSHIPVANLYGCLNANAVEGQDVICTKQNAVIHCYRADKDKKCGYYCSLNGKDCTWGDCEDRCTDDSVYTDLIYEDSGSYEFWGCKNPNGLVCVSIGGWSNGYACYQNGQVCASGCLKDGSNCRYNVCDVENPCPAGTTYDPEAFTCTRSDGVYCSLSPYSGSSNIMCFMPGGMISCGSTCTWDAHNCQVGTCDASDCEQLGMEHVSVEGWYGCRNSQTQITCLKRDDGDFFHCYKDGLLCGTTCTDYMGTSCPDCQKGYECPNGGTYVESAGYGDNSCLYDNGLSCSPWTKNCFINGLPCGQNCNIDGSSCKSGVCIAQECPSGQEPVYNNETKLFACATVDQTVHCTNGSCTINGSLCGQGCNSDGSNCSVGVCRAEECEDLTFTQVSYQFYGCYDAKNKTSCYKNGSTYTCWKNGAQCGDGCTINGNGGSCDTGCN